MAVSFEQTDRFERQTRYLSGELNDVEAEKFERDWARNPAWTQDMELDARLQGGLGELRRRGQLDAAMRGPWWTKSLRILALAATVAGLGFAVWIWQSSTLAGTALLASTPTLRVGNSVAVMRMRSASQFSGVVDLPRDPQSIELRVLPDVVGVAATDTYSMSLDPTAASGTAPHVTLDNLRIGADGFVRVYVDSGKIAPGQYRLSLRRAGARDADEFLILVSEPTAIPHAD